MSRVVKTTVYVPEAEYERLKALARQQKRPAAELVREAVVAYAHRHVPRLRPRSLGVGRSGRSDLSERAEELLTGLGGGE
ncbi:MAG: ribbon-helix-helix protein, CopG family [Thermoanaerobaculia bacterium]